MWGKNEDLCSEGHSYHSHLSTQVVFACLIHGTFYKIRTLVLLLYVATFCDTQIDSPLDHMYDSIVEQLVGGCLATKSLGLLNSRLNEVTQ